jgi:hypothetical protein
MTSQELLDGVQPIVEAHETELADKAAHAMQVREKLADANIAVSEAQAAVKVAEQNLAQANDNVQDLKSAEQKAEGELERVARTVAADIIDGPDLAPLPKTLFSLIYDDRSLAWQETLDAFPAAAERGKVALSAIMERLQPNEPVLYFTRGNIAADVATGQSLVATPPTIDGERGRYVYIKGGSISVTMPESAVAQSTVQGLVKVERKPEEAILMNSYYEHDVERLEVAAGNEEWLVIGSEAVAGKLERLDPAKRLIALTALKAAGVEVPVEVDNEISEKTENNLVALVAFLAAGASQETRTHSVHGRDSWTGAHYSTQVTEETPLTRMAKSVDKQSIKYMAQTIGLSKDVLREKVQAALTSRVDQDTTSLDQLAKDIQSLTALDNLLDAIF